YARGRRRPRASQREEGRGQTVSLRIEGTSSDDEPVEFAASGTVITFRGFLAAYEPGKDEPTEDDEERVLPNLRDGQQVELQSLDPDGHSHQPPARSTGRTLWPAHEARGIA